MRNIMGKHNEKPIDIFIKECMKKGILGYEENDKKNILELLNQTFDENSLENKIKKAKSEYIKNHFENFYKKEFISIVEKTLKGNNLNSEHSKSIQTLINNYRTGVLESNIVSNERREKVFKEVKLSQDVPEFIGEDMRSYGPYKKGEIVSIPLRNAEILIREKFAER